MQRSYIDSASKMSVSPLECRYGLTRLACASCWLPRGKQRSGVGCPASRRALCASGRATDTTAYQCATVWVVSQLAMRSTAMPRSLASARTIEMPLLVLNVCICETVCLGRSGVDAVQQKPYRLPELLTYPQYSQGGSCTVRVTKNRFYVLPQVIRNSNS